MQGIIELARKLQPLACTAVEDGFILCNTDPEELYEPGHVFSTHFQRLGQATLERSSGLETLAAAAGAMGSNDSFAPLSAVQINSVQAVAGTQAEHSTGSMSSAIADESTVEKTGTGLSVAPTHNQHHSRPSDLREYEGQAMDIFAANGGQLPAHADLDVLWHTDPCGWETWTQSALDNSLFDWDLQTGASGPAAVISLQERVLRCPCRNSFAFSNNSESHIDRIGVSEYMPFAWLPNKSMAGL